MSAETTLTTCPSCGSSVRQGSAWCTLCFADLRPVPPPRVPVQPVLPAQPVLHAPPAAPFPAPGPAPFATAPLTAPPLGAALPAADPSGGEGVAVPCPACQAPVRLSLSVCEVCGTGLFDKLKEDQATLVVPFVGDVMRFGKGGRYGVALGISVVGIVVLVALMYLVGAFL